MRQHAAADVLLPFPLRVSEGPRSVNVWMLSTARVKASAGAVGGGPQRLSAPAGFPLQCACLPSKGERVAALVA